MNVGSQEAVEFIKGNRKILTEKFASVKDFPSHQDPLTLFMAGSPGAGKTEFSKEFIDAIKIAHPEMKIVRIDADEVRDFIPQYDRNNAVAIQPASALGAEKLFDHVLKNNQHMILDATLADFDKSQSNIKRAINHSRKVGVVYIYQDPQIAWEFTKKREKLEGRRVPKEIFIKSFIQAKTNANRLKDVFGKEVTLYLVVKNFENKVEKYFINITKIENYLKVDYTEEELWSILN